MDVPALSTLLTPTLVGPDCMVDSHEVRPGLYVGCTLLLPAHRNIKVRVVNTTVEPVTKQDGTCVGNLTPVTVVDKPRVTGSDEAVSKPPPSGDATVVVDTLLLKLPDDLTQTHYNQVGGLLYEFNDIFSRGALDMGRTTLVGHTIDTGG